MLRHEHEEARSEARSERQTQALAPETPLRTVHRHKAGKQSELKHWTRSRAEGRTARRYQAVILLCLLAFLLGLPTTALLWHLLPSQLPLGLTVGGVMMFGGFFGLPVCLIAMAIHLARNARRETFPPEEGVHAVGPLLDRLTTDIFTVTELRFRLTAVLPLLKAKDASLLEPRHYKLLNAALHRHVTSSHPWQPWEKAYLLAVLDAYSRIGDIRAIHDVTRIAQGKVASVLQDAEVRSAALSTWKKKSRLCGSKRRCCVVPKSPMARRHCCGPSPLSRKPSQCSCCALSNTRKRSKTFFTSDRNEARRAA